MEIIENSLSQVLMSLNGKIQITNSIEKMIECLNQNKVPEEW